MATQEQKIIFRKIEEILRNYPKYQKRIEVEIENLKNPQIKKSCGPGGQGGNSYDYKSEMEQIEELKQRISNNISRYKEIIFRIDECLNMVQDHKDYNFIQMKYFDKMTYEEIAEKLEIHIANTYKMRNRILEALEIHFKTQRLIEF
jgi:phage transcriptional regulator, rinA family|nr:MAG TPA: transcriptional activator [Caudoviricetes sp.]